MLNDKDIKTHKKHSILKPLGFSDYNALQMHSFAVLSDSVELFHEESSILKLSALKLRDAHERPEAMEEASVMMVGLNPERVIQGLTVLTTQGRGVNRNFREVYDYSMPNVSDKIVRIILSYTDYINRVVWQKKILVYTNHYFPENFKINDIVNHFDDQEYSVKVITGIPNYPSGKIFQNYGYFKKTNETKGNVKNPPITSNNKRERVEF